MTEKGDAPRIVVNARGEEREVTPAEPARPSAAKEILRDAAIAGAGALAVEATEHVGKAIGKAIGQKFTGGGAGKGGGGGQPPEGSTGAQEGKERPSDLTFTEITRRLASPETTGEYRKYLEAVRKRAIEDVASLDGGRYLDKIRDVIREKLPYTSWNGKDSLVSTFTNLAANYDRQLVDDSGGRRSWRGLISYAMDSEIAKVRLAGIDRKESGNVDNEWRDRHGYSQTRVDSLKEAVDNGHVYDLFPANAEAIVGTRLQAEPTFEELMGEKKSEEEEIDKPTLGRLVSAAERTAEKLEKEEPEIESLEPTENTAEGWARLVFINIARAEEASERSGKTSTEDGRIWLAIDRAINKMGIQAGGKHDLLSGYYARRFPEGARLKEKLRLYFEARKRLNDRYIEVKTANGSLAAMGLGSDDIQLKNLKYTVQEIEPMDWWILINGDKVLEGDLPGLSAKEKRGFLPNVDRGLTAWWNVGSSQYDIFHGVLNNAEFMSRLREAIAKNVVIDESIFNFKPGDVLPDNDGIGEKAEDLSFRILTTTLTLAMFDRDRGGVQGKSEDRDLIWFDTKRLQDYLEKEREPGVDWTIGRYFSREGVLDDWVAKPQNRDLLSKSEKMLRRKKMLQVNAKRNVFTEPKEHYRGEVVADFFNTTVVYVKDDLNPQSGKDIPRKLISYVLDNKGATIDGGWRSIPFFRLGQQAYSGYFSYPLGIGGKITKELGSTSWQKIEEIKPPSFWDDKRGLLDRIKAISPWFNAAEFEFRGQLVREALPPWLGFNPDEIGRISGYANDSDLNVISEPNRGRAKQIIDGLTYGTDSEGRDVKLFGQAKKLSEDYIEKQLSKLRMIYALGVIWPGSLSAIEGAETMLSSSAISGHDFTEIVRAIQASRFLEGEYLEHFKYEVWHEMGLGRAFSSSRRERK